MRVAQISDTHLSAAGDDFGYNRARLRAWLEGVKPDLIINTGDVSMNGAGDPADLDTAAAWHRTLAAPVLAVPGNHDIGDLLDYKPDQLINDDRITTFERIIGPQYWLKDVQGWRLIGLNALLFDSGHPAEEAQYLWLEEALTVPARFAIFLHKPLFIDHAGEGERSYWNVKPPQRQRLRQIFTGHSIDLVASGHLHLGRVRTVAATSHVWGPSCAFLSSDNQEDLGGERRLGAVLHTFADDHVTSDLIALEDIRAG